MAKLLSEAFLSTKDVLLGSFLARPMNAPVKIFLDQNWSHTATHLLFFLLFGRQSAKNPKAPSFQSGWAWNLTGLFFK